MFLALIYILSNVSILYGVSFYVVPVVASLGIIIYYRKFLFTQINSKDLYLVSSMIVIQTIIYYMSGIYKGLGYNILAIYPISYLLTVLFFISIYMLIELTRYISVSNINNTLTRTSRYYLLLITSIYAFIELLFTQEFVISGDSLPVLAIAFQRSMLLAVIAYRIGLSMLLYYRLITLFIEKLFPVQPILDQPVYVLVFSLIFIIQSVFIIHYLMNPVKTKKRDRVKKNTINPQYRRFRKIIDFFMILIFVAILLLLVSGVRLFVVSSGSMTPTLNIGDLVISSKGDVGVGDIIVFIAHKQVIVHRVIEFEYRDGKTLYVTKGDALEHRDPWLVSRSNVIGKVVYIIPMIGIPYYLLMSFFGNYISTLVSLIVFIITYNIYMILREVLYLE